MEAKNLSSKQDPTKLGNENQVLNQITVKSRNKAKSQGKGKAFVNQNKATGSRYCIMLNLMEDQVNTSLKYAPNSLGKLLFVMGMFSAITPMQQSTELPFVSYFKLKGPHKGHYFKKKPN